MAKVKRKVNRNLYACKYCVSDFHRLADYRRHMRVHKSLLPNSPAKPPNALLSRKSDGEGVFDFDGVLQREEEFSPASPGSNAERSQTSIHTTLTPNSIISHMAIIMMTSPSTQIPTTKTTVILVTTITPATNRTPRMEATPTI